MSQLPEKEETMDTELRELLDKANIVFFLGGDPSLIIWKIEEKIETTMIWHNRCVYSG